MSAYDDLITATPGLLRYYDGTTNAGETALTPLAGSGNATLFNSARPNVVGPFADSNEPAVGFDGVNDYANAAGVGSLATWTVECLFRRDGSQADNACLLADQYPGKVNFVLAFNHLSASNGATLHAGFFPGAGDWFSTGGVVVPDLVWTHGLATFDGAMLRLYINGVLASAVAAVSASGGDNVGLYLGCNWVNAAFFKGRIAKAAVYNTVLTLADAQARAALMDDAVEETYATKPEVATISPDVFAALAVRARSGPIRVAVFDDSQGTSPGGAGNKLAHAMTAASVRHTGSIAETTLAAVTNTSDQPLLHSFPQGSDTLSRVSAAKLPPNRVPIRAVEASDPGFLFLCVGDNAHSVVPGAAALDAFDTTGVVVELTVATNATSSELAWKFRPTDNQAVTNGEPVVASGTTAIGIDSGTFDVKTVRIGPLSRGAKRYPQIELAAVSDPVDLLAVRFIDPANPPGCTVDWFGDGGYQADSFVTSHPDTDLFLRSQGYAAAMIGVAVNDAMTAGKPVATFKAHYTTLVAHVRAKIGDPNLPVYLLTETYRPEVDTDVDYASRFALFNEYVLAIFEIAEVTEGTAVINVRRTTEALGWRARGEDFIDLVDQGEWSAGNNYVADVDMVTVSSPYGDTHWAAAKSDVSATGNRPGTGTAHWRQVRIHSEDGSHDTVTGATVKAEVIQDGMFVKLPALTRAVDSVAGNVAGSVGALASQARADVRTAVGVAAANVDTQLQAIATGVTANTTAIGNVATYAQSASNFAQAAYAAASQIDPRGGGADQVTLRFYSDPPTNSVPIADADVWVTSDAAGAFTVAGTLQTDSNGAVTFLLDDGASYYVWLQKDGVQSIRGEAFTAEAD